MCVIACKPKGVSWLGNELMKNCFTRNPDGAGLAWVDEEGLKISKGYFNWKALYKDMKVLEDYPVMLHCRLATHGSKNQANCHPFILENGVVMAHNGIINIPLLKKNMTDSESFGKKMLEKFSMEDLDAPHVRELVEAYIGKYNKISILKPDGNFLIYNQKCGMVHEGIWFSNDSYETVKVVKYNFSNSDLYGTYGKGKVAAGWACDMCGEIFPIEKMKDVDGAIFCEHCYKDYMGEDDIFDPTKSDGVVCAYCGKTVSAIEAEHIYGENICAECYDYYIYALEGNNKHGLKAIA